MSTAARVWLGAYVVVSLVVLAAELVDADTVSTVAFVAAMPLLVAVLVTGRPGRDRLQWTTAAALTFSWLGDWVPDVGGGFLAKIGLFAAAHLAFVIGFWPFRGGSVARRLPVLLAYVVVIGGLLVWIAPRAGGLGWYLVGYGVLLGAMAVLSTGLRLPAGIGGAVFVVSDFSIAVFRFVLPDGWDGSGLLILGTYLLAQLLLVLGVVRTPRPGPPDPMS